VARFAGTVHERHLLAIGAQRIVRINAAPRKRVYGRSLQERFDRLREVRLQLAHARHVPPYLIFHDTTLREMVQRRPSTMHDLHDIYGVGAKKAADFGDAFLDAIRTFCRPA